MDWDCHFYWILEVWDVGLEDAPVIGLSSVHHVTSWWRLVRSLIGMIGTVYGAFRHFKVYLDSIWKNFLDTQGCCWWVLNAFRILCLDVLCRTYWKQPWCCATNTLSRKQLRLHMDRSCKGLHINDAFQCFLKAGRGKDTVTESSFSTFLIKLMKREM